MSRKDGTLTSHLSVAEANGRGVTRLTGGKKSQLHPVWSPDHLKVAYFQHKAGPGFPGSSDIFVMGADGSGRVMIIDRGEDPGWSPDGSKLVFAYPEVDNYEIATASSVDGSGLTTLTDSPGYDEFEPDWSPNGTQVVFVRDELAAGEHIFRVDTTGANLVPLTTGSENFDAAPRWSPDGSKIAFIRNQDVWVMAPDGTDLVNLTNSTQSETFSPAWSPDGTKILFSRYRRRSYTIYEMSADGTGVVKLISRGGVANFDPDWGTG